MQRKGKPNAAGPLPSVPGGAGGGGSARLPRLRQLQCSRLVDEKSRTDPLVRQEVEGGYGFIDLAASAIVSHRAVRASTVN